MGNAIPCTGYAVGPRCAMKDDCSLNNKAFKEDYPELLRNDKDLEVFLESDVQYDDVKKIETLMSYFMFALLCVGAVLFVAYLVYIEKAVSFNEPSF